MLAVKAVIAELDSIPVLIFDEIDANLGGETGSAVGEKLKSVSEHHQVIAITHLPQSAVHGDRHMVVSKTVSGGRTRSAIQEVKGETRAREVARMLGGETATSVVLRHARELLGLA
jgi:DNA repair protein RecN (Recombination protein N)